MTRAPAGAAAAAAVAALVLAACGQVPSSSTWTTSDPAHASSSPAKPKLVGTTGGTVTIALDQVPTTLNDHTVLGDNPATRYVASAIWPQVFQVGEGQTPVLDTTVVQSAELVSVSPQTVVYQIDPRATWSDGVPIGVDDFVYAWRSQRGGASDVDGTPDSVATTLGYRDIASVTGSNNGKTVTVVFKNPFGDWASLFDDLLPAHVAELAGWNQGFDTFDPTNLVSGGPWYVQSWQPGVQLVLGRNPHWWGATPHLDRIVIQAATMRSDLLHLLVNGTAQVGYPSSFDTSLLADLSSDPSLETRESLGTTMLQLVFNTRHSPFDNVAVRQGVAHTIDRAGLVTDLVQPLNSSVWEDNNHLFANAQPQYSDDAAGYVQSDPVTAAHLLAQGGLVADPNGTWTFHGAPVTIQFVWAEDDPWSAAVAPSVASQLTLAGFDVSSDPVSSPVLNGFALPEGAFDLALVPIAASAYPTATAQYFTSATDLTTPGTNVDWSGFSDPTLEALFTSASEQLGTNLANPLYRQVDEELWADMPSLPLFAEPTLLVDSAWVNGVLDDPGGLGPLFSATSWYRLGVAPHKSAKA